jgi:3-mercaptopyruvate sulfurtransferase SseA
MSEPAGRDGPLVSVQALAAELAQDPAPVLLDVRWQLGGPPGLETYRRGHLPGAVFTDLDRDLAGPPGPAGRHPLPDPAAFQTAGNVNPDGTFKDPAGLAARFKEMGTVPGAAGPVGAYCGSGVTAAHEVLALALAGIPAALYVGSWSNWVSDPARPVAAGGGPDDATGLPAEGRRST